MISSPGCLVASAAQDLRRAATIRKHDDPTTKTEGAKLHHLKGKISHDGKCFTSDKDEKSDAMKGRLSSNVDPSNNSIHVISVKIANEKKPGTMWEQPLSDSQTDPLRGSAPKLAQISARVQSASSRFWGNPDLLSALKLNLRH